MDLEHLPIWLQVMVAIGVFFGTALAAGLGYTKKKLARKLEGQQSQDTVVISAAFADGKLLRDLMTAIDNLRQSNEDIGARALDASARQTDAVRTLNDTVNRLGEFLRSALK